MLSLDMLDRGDFLRWFYRRYEDAKLADLDKDTWELTSDLLLEKAFPAGIRQVREHRPWVTGPSSLPARSTLLSSRCARSSTTSCAHAWGNKPGNFPGSSTRHHLRERPAR